MVGAFGGLAELGLVGLFVGPVIMAALLLVLRQWIVPVQPVAEPSRSASMARNGPAADTL